MRKLSVLHAFVRLSFTVLCLIAGEALYAQQTDKTDKVLTEALRKADEAWKDRDYVKAATQYNVVATQTPDNHYVGYRLAESYRRIFNYPAAATWYAKVADTHAETYPIALYYYALVQKRNRNFAEAHEHFNQFLTRNIKLTSQAEVVVKQFEAKAQTEIVTCEELARTETTPSVSYFDRNKLGDFPAEYRIKADPIVKRKEAGIIHKEEMPLYGEEAYFFNYELTSKQRTRLSKLMATGPGDLGLGTIVAEKKLDKQYYEQLNEADKNRVDRMAMAYRRAVNFNVIVHLNEEDEAYHYSLTRSQQQQLDRAVAYRMSRSTSAEIAEAEKEEDFTYQPVSEVEVDRVEVISKTKHADPNQPAGTTMAEADRFYYEQLSAEDKARLERIIESQRAKSQGQELALSKEDQFHYNQLSEEEQARLARLLQERLAKQNHSDSQLAKEEGRGFEHVAEKESTSAGRATQKTSKSDWPDWVLALSKEDRFYYEHLSAEDRARVNRMVEAGFLARRENTDPQLLAEDEHYYTSLPELDQQRLDRMAGIRLVKSDAQDTNLAKRQTTKDKRSPKAVQSKTMAASTRSTANAIDFENVHFNFDDFTLRSEAVKVLDDLLAFYRQFPDMHIDIHAYADDLGDDAYNMQLCKKRGQTVRSYLLSHGMKSSSLKIHPRGKDELTQSTDPVVRQINRRVEFHIKGGPETYSSPVKTYILQPDATLYSIAKAFGLTVEELMELNGLTSNHIEAYRPIRVKGKVEELPTPMVAFAKRP